MESLNLYNLYTTAKLKIKDYCSYEKVLSKRHKIANLGEREKLSLYHLVDFLIENNCEILKMDNFYYSYVIPHIGKEFDLLKIDTNYILNIELKSQNVGLERIKTQLLTNYKYLKYLSKKMYLFTFVSDVREFYFLNDSLELEKCSVSNVLNAINLFGNEKIEIDKLFKVSEFLVSPVATPDKFINGQYFLTTQQEFIKNKLIETMQKESCFKITGDAGTGKTLLLFDIAKKLNNEGKVLIILGNKMTSSHLKIMRELNVSIVDQDHLVFSYEKIREAKYILVDESQRIKAHIWHSIVNIFDEKRQKLVFSLDPKQVLTKEEIKNNINSLIDGLNIVKYKLSNKIRINNSVANFTYRIFDLSLNKYPLDLSNVDILFANNVKELNTYLKMYLNDYIFIDILNTNLSLSNKVSIDQVLGMDFDNVLMILDERYYYNNNLLKSENSKTNDSLYLKLLYQGLSRTREKLVLIIYKNKNLFNKIISEGASNETIK